MEQPYLPCEVILVFYKTKTCINCFPTLTGSIFVTLPFVLVLEKTKGVGSDFNIELFQKQILPKEHPRNPTLKRKGDRYFLYVQLNIRGQVFILDTHGFWSAPLL